ncbi:MAG: hypothetical protein DCF12_22310 [Snowella sp.]|nr:MAG: hypothetical protein DCF12_22310 [Snowella sp.]
MLRRIDLSTTIFAPHRKEKKEFFFDYFCLNYYLIVYSSPLEEINYNYDLFLCNWEKSSKILLINN